MFHNFFALLFTFIIGMFLFGIPLRIVLRKRTLLSWSYEMQYYAKKLTSISSSCRKRNSYPLMSDLIFLIQLPYHMDFYVLNRYWENDTWIDGNFFGLFRYDLKPFVECVSKLKDKATTINGIINEGFTKCYTTVEPVHDPLNIDGVGKVKGVVLKSSNKDNKLEEFISDAVDCLTLTISICVDYTPAVRKEIYFWSAISAIGLFATLFMGASLVQ